jgi:signal transduction histidine kinase
MLDLIPPIVILCLSIALTGSLSSRLSTIPHSRYVLTSLLGLGIYGLGMLIFVLLGGPEAIPAADGIVPGWKPGAAVSLIGTFLIPGAVVFTVNRSKAVRSSLVLLGIGAWLLIWIPPLRPIPWSIRISELLFALYLSVAILFIGFGLRRRPDGPLATRIGVFFLPFLAVSLAYLLFKGSSLRRPIASTSIQAGALIVLLPLVGKHAKRELQSEHASAVLQAVLLGLGAVLLLVLAANMGLFPKEAGPLLVASLVATGLAVAYSTLRPAFDRMMNRALTPEAARSEQRVRELQAELEATRGRLNRAEHLSVVGQLAAQVAHEIKNPLGPIRGYTKIIEREILKLGALSEVVQRGIGIIRQEVETIDARAQGLLKLARPPEPRLEEIDLAALGQDVIDLVGCDVPSGTQIGWVNGAQPDAALTHGDAVLLRGALLNVAQNSVQAMATAGGRVELSLTVLDDGGHELRIEDTGPGLPTDDPEELFRAFVSHREGGSGLGLLIARGSLRSMQGELTLGTREGGGASAVFMLPANGGQVDTEEADE